MRSLNFDAASVPPSTPTRSTPNRAAYASPSANYAKQQQSYAPPLRSPFQAMFDEEAKLERTSPGAPVGASASKRKANTPFNSGLGAKEKRIQAFYAPPLMLAEETTASKSFQPPAATPPPARYGPKPERGPALPLLGSSTMASSFQEHTSAQAPYHSPAPKPREQPTPFQGTTTSASSYRAYEDADAPYQRTSSPQRAKPLPFTGTSTMSSSFASPRDEDYVSPKRNAAPTRGQPLPLLGASTLASSYAAPGEEAYASPSRRAPATRPEPLPLMGSSTMASSYAQPGEDAYASPSRRPQPTRGETLPLTGESTLRADFPPQPVEPQRTYRLESPARQSIPLDAHTTSKDAYPAPAEEEYASSPYRGVVPPDHALFRGASNQPLESETTSTAAFKGWTLPERRPALGVATVDEPFFEVLPASETGVRVRSSRAFSTCADGQLQIEVNVVKLGKHGVEPLGSFELVGIPPGPAGTRAIDVIFDLSADNVLHVEARDRESGKDQFFIVSKKENPHAFEA